MRFNLTIVAVAVSHLIVVDSLCAVSERCAVECGDSCMDECNIVSDHEEIEEAVSCRRKIVDQGGKLVCSEFSCTTPKECVSTEQAQCFFSCESECHETHEVADIGANECSLMCSNECNRLFESGDDEEGSDEERSAAEVSECIKLCSVGSGCPARDEIFEFDALQSSGRVVKTLIPGSVDVAAGEEWAYSESPERASLMSALEDPESETSQRYVYFIEKIHELNEMGGGLPGGMSAAELMAAMGLGDGEADGMSEEDMMNVIQQMMGGMGVGGYGDEYADYGDMFGDAMGGYGDAPDDEYEEDFEEEDDFSM